MDNYNNNSEIPEGGFTYPAEDGGASVLDNEVVLPCDESDVSRDEAIPYNEETVKADTDDVQGQESEPVFQQPAFSQGQYPQPPEWTKNIVVSDKPWIETGENGNVSVQFNESEKELPPPTYESIRAAKSSADKKELPMWMQIGVVFLAALVVFALMRYISRVRNTEDDFASLDVNAVTVVPTIGNTEEVTMPSTAPSVSVTTPDKTTEAEKESTTAVEKEEKTTAENKKPSSHNDESKVDKNEAKVKVIEYFNESSNRVKTEAVKVVKDHEKRTHNEDKLELPAAIKGIGKSLLESKITDITEPVEYATPEDIISRYPAPGQEWSSILTEEEVESATCVENGDEYEIIINLYDCTDPEPGKGTSKAMDCLDVPTVRDTAPPFITSFSAEYYDCVIRCIVDKKSGRVIHADYTTPVVIKVGLDAGFTQFDAEIGITFEKSYTVTY